MPNKNYYVRTHASACGISSLDYKVFDHSVEYCAIVVALQAQLDEISAGLGSLLWPQLKIKVTNSGGKNDLAICGGFYEEARHCAKQLKKQCCLVITRRGGKGLIQQKEKKHSRLFYIIPYHSTSFPENSWKNFRFQMILDSS